MERLATRIADATRQGRQRRVMRLGLFRDDSMGRRRPDMQPAVTDADALHLGNTGQADQHAGCGKPLLHRRDQRLPAGQGLRPICGQCLGRIGNRRGFREIKVVHDVPLNR